MTTKIPITPAVKRLNAAVQRADALSDFEFDRCLPEELAKWLRANGFPGTSSELLTAYEAVAHSPVDNKPTGD